MVGIVAVAAAVAAGPFVREPAPIPPGIDGDPAWWRMTTLPALHTPLEELLFFQSLRTLGADTASFARISDTLKENEFVRSHPNFNAERLSPRNLQDLYLRLLKDEARSSIRGGPTSPAKGADANPRKRKLSSPPLQSLDEAAQHTHLLPQLVDRLYARYQEHTIHAIREDEARYEALSKDIAEIEAGQWDERLAKDEAVNGLAAPASTEMAPPPLTSGVKVEKDLSSAQVQAPTQRQSPERNILSTPSVRTPRPSATKPPAAPLSTPAGDTSAPSPSLPPPELPAAIKSRTSKSPQPPSKATPGTVPSSSAQPSGFTPQPPIASPRLPGTPQTGTPGQMTFQLQQGQPFVPYAAYGPQAALPTYPSPSPAPPTVSYPPGTQRPPQATPSSQAPSYGGFSSPHAGYVMYPPPVSGFPTPNLVSYQTPASGNVRKPHIPHINTNISTTKWRSSGPVQKSPVAPPHSPFFPSSPELSPSDEISKTPIPPNHRLDEAQETDTPSRPGPRRGRGAAPTGRGRPSRADARSARGSPTRSQSTTSHADESAPEIPQARRLRGVDASTPIATDETSAMSTPVSAGRLGHRRNTLRGSVDIGHLALKRKRANTLEGSPIVPTLPRAPMRPNHVLATKNFHRIVQPLMQEINAHKLASIFAKPITERDAPGYQSIIYQPQDLKSIRAAISAGTRAIQAAEKESAEAGEDAGSPAAVPGNVSSGAKSSSTWLEKSADVTPPKAIVNAAQMEKEVYRMFANAVMFNLDPHRGLGAAERRPRGAHEGDDDNDSEEDDAEKHYEVDDGGAFVRDAREMFESVEQSTSRWRAVEGGSKARAGEESETEGATEA